jgi:hypothetical protein
VLRLALDAASFDGLSAAMRFLFPEMSDKSYKTVSLLILATFPIVLAQSV